MKFPKIEIKKWKKPTWKLPKFQFPKFSKAEWIRWLLIPLLGFAAMVYAFVLPGYSFSALVCCGIIGILLFYNLMALWQRKKEKPAKTLRRVFTVCLCIGLLVAGITECFILEASFGDPKEHCDYMVILGAKVRIDGPSVALQNRIDAAYEYMTAHPDVIAVASGGQGPDEHMTEAQCIKDELVAMGIDEGRILLEENSTSTWENLNFTLDLIEQTYGTRPEVLGLLSSEYHMFRAGLLAEKCGIDPVGIPAHTSRFSQLINHLMREIAGVWHYILLGE